MRSLSLLSITAIALLTGSSAFALGGSASSSSSVPANYVGPIAPTATPSPSTPAVIVTPLAGSKNLVCQPAAGSLNWDSIRANIEYEVRAAFAREGYKLTYLRTGHSKGDRLPTTSIKVDRKDFLSHPFKLNTKFMTLDLGFTDPAAPWSKDCSFKGNFPATISGVDPKGVKFSNKAVLVPLLVKGEYTELK